MVGAGAPVMLVAALAAPQSWVFGLAYLGAALALIAMDGLVVLMRYRVESQVTCPAMMHIGGNRACHRATDGISNYTGGDRAGC
jgi:hypothetical protein